MDISLVLQCRDLKHLLHNESATIEYIGPSCEINQHLINNMSFACSNAQTNHQSLIGCISSLLPQHLQTALSEIRGKTQFVHRPDRGHEFFRQWQEKSLKKFLPYQFSGVVSSLYDPVAKENFGLQVKCLKTSESPSKMKCRPMTFQCGNLLLGAFIYKE